VAVHVVAGLRVGGGGVRDALAVLAAPAYIVWKVATLAATVRSGRAAAGWVRTAREPQGQTAREPRRAAPRDSHGRVAP
jgi:hypothetical protein